MVLATVGALALGLSSTTSASASASSTITYAEGPGAAPNWILPYTGYLNFSASNINEFQQLMYRPLYFFGEGATTAYDPSLSLAATPVVSANGRTITIHLKGWRFADGQIVNAASVMFFLNLYHADPTSYGGYTPGVGIPDDLASASGSGLTVVLRMKTAVNANWFLYNYLSEITPMPDRWDMISAHAAGRCASGTYGAASTDASCKAVEAYLDKLATTTSTFTSAFWQGGDDGPWRLTAFDSAGDATFQSNPHYSGPEHAQVHSVKEVAYTSEASEVGDLESGKLDIGYVDPSDLLVPATKSGSAGANLPALNAKYRLSVSTPYAFNFAEMNYTTTNPLQAEFEELYVRQALQESLDEASIVRNVDDNYAVATYSPLPPTAAPALAKAPKSSYTYNLASAKALLTSHGWSEVGNVMTCTNPGTTAGHCGTNIAQGATLNFTLLYVTGDPTIDATVNAMVTDWQNLGISVTATATTFNLLATECTTGSGTPWSMCWSGQSWTYQPNLYPSGEQTFLLGADSNWGGYDDSEMNALISADMTSKATLSTYEQYAANQLPVLYLPTQETLTETARSLQSSAGWATNGLSDFLPEYLHY
ncbi:MAG: ABC transporter substrate-binding protein [Acidimicrobiales bacterium]